MSEWTWILLLSLPCLVGGQCSVAIVGAGMGGCTAAYYLRQQQPDCQIHLFEREAVGGRMMEFTWKGKVYELGASIIHGWNSYAMNAAKALGLTTIAADDTGPSFHIYDGSKFVFSQEDGLAGMVTALKRYGIAPLRYASLAKATGRKFGNIYDLQEAGRCYRSPDELLQALGLLDLTTLSASDYAKSQLTWLYSYGAERFMNELAGAVNRINYNQHNSQMNAFAGLVSYLPAAEPDVHFIKGGNRQLAARLLDASKADAVHLGTRVTRVTQLKDGTWQLHAAPVSSAAAAAGGPAAEGAAEGNVQGPYSAVILAAPIKQSNITFSGVVLPPIQPREYQTTVTTYVEGDLNPAYFNVAELPEGDVFVTDDADTPFSVIASKGRVQQETQQSASSSSSSNGEALETTTSSSSDGCSGSNGTCSSGGTSEASRQQQGPMLWKMFSAQPVPEALLSKLFTNYTVVQSKEWKAYPRYHPPESLAPFLLAPGLVYNNALEESASAMEVAMVAAKNSVLLVTNSSGCAGVAAGSSGTGTSSAEAASRAPAAPGSGVDVS